MTIEDEQIERERLAKKIVEWLADNGQAESRYATPDPQHFVYTFGLLDFLAKDCGLEGKAGEWFNARQEVVQKERERRADRRSLWAPGEGSTIEGFVSEESTTPVGKSGARLIPHVALDTSEGQFYVLARATTMPSDLRAGDKVKVTHTGTRTSIASKLTFNTWTIEKTTEENLT